MAVSNWRKAMPGKESGAAKEGRQSLIEAGSYRPAQDLPRFSVQIGSLNTIGISRPCGASLNLARARLIFGDHRDTFRTFDAIARMSG
jgi:hypothetical protein